MNEINYNSENGGERMMRRKDGSGKERKGSSSGKAALKTEKSRMDWRGKGKKREKED